jgi:hypothetical protein
MATNRGIRVLLAALIPGGLAWNLRKHQANEPKQIVDLKTLNEAVDSIFSRAVRPSQVQGFRPK